MSANSGGSGEDLGGAGRPLSEGSPYPPSLPDPPRTSPKSTRPKQNKSNLCHARAGALGGSFCLGRELILCKVRLSHPIGKRDAIRCDALHRISTSEIQNHSVSNIPMVSGDLSPLISRLRDSFPPRGSLLYTVHTWQIQP